MDLYPYLVAAHVTVVVFFVGGVMAQDRMVHAVAQLPHERQADTLEVIVRLHRYVTTPAMLLSWIFGLSLALWSGWLGSNWLNVKLAFVVFLSALHGIQSGRLRRFLNTKLPAKTIPWAGVAIPVAMIAIAILAFTKPG